VLQKMTGHALKCIKLHSDLTGGWAVLHDGYKPINIPFRAETEGKLAVEGWSSCKDEELAQCGQHTIQG
jgi:hypothetical protein